MQFSNSFHFRLLFGGTIPHYFYALLEKIVPDGKHSNFYKFLGERLAFAPLYAALSLYFLARFEVISVPLVSVKF